MAKIRSEILTGYLASENLTANVHSEKRVYRDKHGNISEMNTENIGMTTDKEKSSRINSFDSSASEDTDSQSINDPNFPLHPNAKQLEITEALTSSNSELAKQFEIGQLVKIQLANFDGVSEDLKLANHSYGQLTSLTENGCSFNVNVLGHKSFVLSPEDIKPVDKVQFCVEFTPEQFIALMSIHQSRDGIERAILKGAFSS